MNRNLAPAGLIHCHDSYADYSHYCHACAVEDPLDDLTDKDPNNAPQ